MLATVLQSDSATSTGKVSLTSSYVINWQLNWAKPQGTARASKLPKKFPTTLKDATFLVGCMDQNVNVINSDTEDEAQSKVGKRSQRKLKGTMLVEWVLKKHADVASA